MHANHASRGAHVEGTGQKQRPRKQGRTPWTDQGGRRRDGGGLCRNGLTGNLRLRHRPPVETAKIISCGTLQMRPASPVRAGHVYTPATSGAQGTFCIKSFLIQSVGRPSAKGDRWGPPGSPAALLLSEVVHSRSPRGRKKSSAHPCHVPRIRMAGVWGGRGLGELSGGLDVRAAASVYLQAPGSQPARGRTPGPPYERRSWR